MENENFTSLLCERDTRENDSLDRFRSRFFIIFQMKRCCRGNFLEILKSHCCSRAQAISRRGLHHAVSLERKFLVAGLL